MPEWYFEPYSINGSFNASAGRRLLEGTEMKQPETLARESLQNACDAHAEGADPVRTEFRLLDADSHSVPDIPGLLNLDAADGPRDRGLIRTPDPMKLLYIEDFNTVGLGGTSRGDVPSTAEDNFVRLCRNIGDTPKIEARGGTFGFGKAVYWSNSAIHLVAFYSRFRPTERTGGSHSRFIAAGWFQDHDFEGRRYTGRAWLGDRAEVEGSETIQPLENEEADEIAAKLGFRERTKGQLGTSMLVVGAQEASRSFLLDLREAVETHYWPRLMEERLDVSFFYGSELVDEPDPTSRIDLRPYLDAYRYAIASAPSDELPPEVHLEDLSYSPQSSSASYDLGRVAAVMKDTAPGTSREDETTQGVALMRAPRMVVDYYHTRGFPEASYGAVFVASGEVEEILRRSEPPAHDAWSQSSNELDSEESKVVHNTLAKIRGSVTDFLETFVEEESGGALVCEEVSREMAQYLSVRGAGIGPQSTERMVWVRFRKQPHRQPSTSGQHRVASTIEVGTDREMVQKYREDNDGDRPGGIRVEVSLTPIVETGRKLRERIPVDVLTGSDGGGTRENGELVLPLEGEPGSFRVNVISAPLPSPEITIDMTVDAELVSQEESEG